MSRRKLRYAAAGLLLVAVLGAGVLAWLRSNQTKWPAFPQVGSAPVAVSDLVPDFSWRTGDVVPVTVYVKEAPDTVCDLKSVTIKGDFQLRSVNTYTETLEDGTRLIRIKLELQTFSLKPVWKATPFITYRVGQSPDRTQLELPEFEIGSSNTYDKRKIERVTKTGEKIQLEDKHPKDQPAEYLVSYSWVTDVTVASLALMMVAVCIWVIATRPRPEKAKDAPLIPNTGRWFDTVGDVRKAVQELVDGKGDRQTYVRVQRGLLRLFRLDAVSLPEIERAADGGCDHLASLRHILGFCHRVIYSQEAGLPPEEIRQLADLVPEALQCAPRFNGMPAAVTEEA